jgi:hypothetical protein
MAEDHSPKMLTQPPIEPKESSLSEDNTENLSKGWGMMMMKFLWKWNIFVPWILSSEKRGCKQSINFVLLHRIVQKLY